MKKLIVAAVAVFAFSVNAQEVKFGAKAGLNLANLSGDLDGDNDMKIGFNVGGFAEIKLSDKFYLQPELLFSTQGTKAENSRTSNGITYKNEGTFSLNYVNIPIMAKYYIAEGFSAEFGPQIGFLASVKREVTTTISGNGFNETETESSTSKDNLSTVDFGLNIGASYDINENIFVNARYNIGLNNVYDISGTDLSQKNNVISFNVGYKF